MPFDRAEFHFAEAAIYQEYKPEGENRTLPFNPIALQAEEEDDDEVEGDKEDGEPNPLNPTQQLEEVHTIEELVKEAPKCMNDGVKNVQEELVEVNLGDGEEDKKVVKISKNLFENERGRLVALLKEYNDVFAWSY
nr:hypothetical protein CFP56_55264 [Quercus suber]